MERLKSSEYIKNGYISAEKKRLTAFFDTHCHDFFEIEYIIAGSGSYTVDGITYPLENGLLFFMTPANIHSVDSKNAIIYNIMFSGNICNTEFLSVLIKNSPIALKNCGADATLFEALMEEMTQKNYNQETLYAFLNTILGKLCFEAGVCDNASNISSVNQAELYILNNFKKEITLTDVAKHVSLAPTYLSKIFKNQTGENFKAYLNSVRFEYAKKLLTLSDKTVMQICNECGFGDYPNFIRRFKQHTGLYPNEYRKNGRS